ncbi:MAG: hypothetical protein RL095_1966 [Verrucomicrobiota bacterium]
MVNLQICKQIFPGRLNGNRLILDPYTALAEMADGGVFTLDAELLCGWMIQSRGGR